ncbi:MAG: AAA family ATPase, partial [Sulfuricurvum sp.]|nr:AAA family ATPase [Sulfuricurvum sp.]
MKTKSLYISSLESSVGSLIVTMGIMEHLKGKLEKVAFFRPVIPNSSERDKDIDFMMNRYPLGMEYTQMYCYTVDEIEGLIAQNLYHEVLEKVIEKFKSLERCYDFVLIEGLNHSYFSNTLDFDINLSIAKNLNSPYISILKGEHKELKAIKDEIHIEAEAIKSAGCQH